jgi:hypothetical protein
VTRSVEARKAFARRRYLRRYYRVWCERNGRVFRANAFNRHLEQFS